MTSKETYSGLDAKTKERGAAGQSEEAKNPLEKPNDQAASSSAHPVPGQGAPGGTCDDDGDSDNQQDLTRRASWHANKE